ncbi:uncharacterized protein EV420DRAFT_1664209 [Desarmillaria tabescens]|uniref:Uncharacterized protein n=1 Tax=Armillaria tabescens TaxID=1929756 RepID=A0AA39NRC2_ARMTA|nr:uncharacterized protein EV420DRAFT_1664209 [Desarmillaria tabescens]KAK0470432.1 hypothetical protein EV420DRAFT_1664209 [Desarmillaria tabescens]
MASDLPHLEELKFDFHIAFSMPCIIPAIGRSRTTLTSISMSTIHLFRLDTNAFIAAMHSCHNLRTIEIKEEPEIIVVGLHAMPEPLSDVETDGAVAVLRSFTPSYDGAVPCPHLETFKLEIHCYPCVESNLIASRKSQLANAALLMIQNRRTVDSTVKQVQIGVIYRDGWPVNLIEEYGSLSSVLTDHGPVTNADLRNWKASGLSFEFRWHRTLYTY